MSRIDDLLARYAPNGVRFEPLGNVGRWYGGGTPSKGRADFWENGTIPWVSPKDMGRHVVEVTEDYITEAAVAGSATKMVPANSVAIVVRSSILDRILPTSLIPIPVALNQDMKAVVAREGIMPAFIAHVLRSGGDNILRSARKTGGSVASIDTTKLYSFLIPVPPIEIQQEVVAILDSFTKLEAELEAELEARRAQYRHYRDSLLSFEQTGRQASKQASKQAIRIACLGELGNFIRGRRFTKDDYASAGVPCIHYGEIYTRYGVWTDRVVSHVRSDMARTLRYAEPGDVVITDVGETVEDVGKAVAWIGDERVAIHDHCYAFRHDMNPKFVAYCMQTSSFTAQKTKYVARTKVNTLLINAFANIRIPVPPREEQDRIVGILDKFDALVNDLSSGLPAEIAARRRQYGHYRDRLLTFRQAA